MSLEGGNPWGYLDGTNIPFGINGGDAQVSLAAVYNFIQVAGLGISIVLILSSVVGIIYSQNSSRRAQEKQVLGKRFSAMFVIGLATSLLTLLMNICNYLFAV